MRKALSRAVVLIATTLLVGTPPASATFPGDDTLGDWLIVTHKTGADCVDVDALDSSLDASRRPIACAPFVALSEDGTRAAEAHEGGVAIVDLRTGARTDWIDTAPLLGRPIEWSPGGQWLQWVTCVGEYTSCNQVFISAPDGTDRNRLPMAGPGGPYVWSRDDRLFMLATDEGPLLGNGDGSRLQVVESELDVQWFEPSPDGAHIAFGLQEAGPSIPTGNTVNAFVADADTLDAQMRDLTGFDSGLALGGSWSPDGTKLAIMQGLDVEAGRRAHRGQLWIVGLDGSRHQMALPIEVVDPWKRGWGHENVAWSPDGSRLAFGSDVDQPRVVVVPIDGSPGLVLDGADQPVWSPDGRYVAFVGGSSGSTVEVVRADGSERRSVDVDGLLWGPLRWARSS